MNVIALVAFHPLRTFYCMLAGVFFFNPSITLAALGQLTRHQRRTFSFSLLPFLPIDSTAVNTYSNSRNSIMSLSFAPVTDDDDDDTARICRHDSPFLFHATTNNSNVLVILNSPIAKPPSLLFQRLWESSIFRICADGGANRLYDVQSDEEVNDYIPDAICGDLDSLRQNVREYYQERGTSIQQDVNQDVNDLDKALQLVHARRNEIWNSSTANRRRVCVYGAFGGRFDQEMACIQALYKWSEVFDYKLFLCDDNTCAFLLSDVITNEIRLPFYGESPANEQENVPDDLVGEGPTCGLIPIGHRCEFVRTTGLKWNLDGSVALEFGGMVSTSNRAMNELITVQASHPLVFTAEITPGRTTR